MAATSSQEGICSLVETGSRELETKGNTDIQDLILPQVHDVRAKTKNFPSKHYQSKGVPCSDPKMLCQILQKSQQADSSSQSILEANCLSVELELHGDTPADGNCFFEAVSSQLRRLNCVVQKSSQQLRQEVVAFMRTNRVIQASEGTIHLDSFVYNESFDVYCSRMARDSEWADHVVVVAMARMLQIDIMIVTSSPSSGPEDIIVWVTGQTAFQGDPILLGHVWEFHYVSLQPIGNTDIQDLILPQTHDVRAKTKSVPSKPYQSKGVLCSDPKMLCQILQKSQQADSSSQSILEANCLSVELELHGDTPADGNCFFEAVSSQLRRLNCVVQKSSQQLRQEVVAFMRTNRVIQASEGTIHLDSFVYNESFDVYCSRMARDSEWADHVVVVAMARMLQIDIMIVTSSPSSGPEDIIVWVTGQTAFQGDPILLGHVWEFHYVSLQPIGNTDIQDLILPQTHDVRAKTKSVPSKPYQSKGVLCSDPKMLCQILQKSQQVDSSSQSKLEENCLSMGLELHGDTPADGNCFFEPVSSRLQCLNCFVHNF